MCGRNTVLFAAAAASFYFLRQAMRARIVRGVVSSSTSGACSYHTGRGQQYVPYNNRCHDVTSEVECGLNAWLWASGVCSYRTATAAFLFHNTRMIRCSKTDLVEIGFVNVKRKMKIICWQFQKCGLTPIHVIALIAKNRNISTCAYHTGRSQQYIQ